MLPLFVYPLFVQEALNIYDYFRGCVSLLHCNKNILPDKIFQSFKVKFKHLRIF